MSTSDEPIVTLRVSSAADLSDAYNMLDRNVKRRLERLPGVSKVELQGVDPKEVRILLDSARVAAHGVDLNALRERLAKSNFAVSGGRVTAGGSRMSLRPRGEFASLDELRDLVVNESGLRLGDLGEVELRSPDRDYGRRLDGTYAVSINVFKSTGANMVEVADRVIEEIGEIGTLPEMRGLKLFELNNQADGVRQSLSDLLQAGTHRRPPGHRRVVRVSSPMVDDPDRHIVRTVFVAGYPRRFIFRGPYAQYSHDDGSHARGRHVGRQFSGRYGEHFPPSSNQY